MDTEKVGRYLYVKSTTSILQLTREAIEFVLYVREQEKKLRDAGSKAHAFAPRTLQFVERVGVLLPKAVGGDVADVVSIHTQGATKLCQPNRQRQKPQPRKEQTDRQMAKGSKARQESTRATGRALQSRPTRSLQTTRTRPGKGKA